MWLMIHCPHWSPHSYLLLPLIVVVEIACQKVKEPLMCQSRVVGTEVFYHLHCLELQGCGD